ncbi:MAG: DUF1217 domain-containing protein [Acetobacter papayae]|uniref:DUF1217 domain-containing protein n=1 Tax=Acetobacter papayae TaxID=1076592 RepID=UPI0039E8098C
MAISTVSPITSYLAAVKDESTAAAAYAKTDTATLSEVATFEKDAASITTVDGLLKNYSVLQVVLGAYGLSSLSGETAVIKDLLTQDPSSSTSLAATSDNASWKAFAEAFAVWSDNDGVSTVSPFTTSDDGTVSVSSTPTETTQLTLDATLPSSSSSVDSYTTAAVATYDSSGNETDVALQWTRSSTDPLTWTVSAYDASGDGAVGTNSYTVTFNSDGSIASVGNAVSGESIVTSSDSGSTAYIPVTLTGSSGTSQSIKLVLGTVGGTTGTVMATSDDQTASTSQAESLSGSGTSLTMSSVVLGTTTGSDQSYLSSPLDPDETVDDSDSIPASVRDYLSVKWTQTGNSTWSVSLVNPYDSSSVTSASLYTVTFDSTGNVSTVNGVSTDTIPALSATMNGETYSVSLESPTLSMTAQDTETTLTSDSSTTTSYTGVDMATVVANFEDTQYEDSTANQKSGLGNALYFTREISGVTSLTQLMSDSTLTNVVETVLGYDPDQVGALDYDQQVQLLTGKVDFSQFTTSEGIQKYAEQYLAMLQINPPSSDSTLTTMDLFGGSNSSEGIAALFDVSSSSSSSSSSLYSDLF